MGKESLIPVWAGSSVVVANNSEVGSLRWLGKPLYSLEDVAVPSEAEHREQGSRLQKKKKKQR